MLLWNFNPSNATSIKAQERKDFLKPSKPCHIDIHCKVLAEYPQISTHVPGFHSFFRIFAFFVLAKVATSSVMVKFFSVIKANGISK